jgi:NAD(P)-dependent dehydrogenase (short-subunit alcohol dehydrogenase family)
MAIDLQNLTDKGVVITGAASGIGLATALALAGRGARLLLADIETEALARAAEQVSAAGASVVATQTCDIASLEAVQALAEVADQRLGGTHILFNNAGVAVGGPIAEMSHDDWRWIIDVDLWGAIHGVEAFLPRMVAQGQGGHILFTASFAGLVPNVGLGPYCVAKYGVVALAEVLRREVRDDDIGVSVLCPMRVGTNIGGSQRNRSQQYGGVGTSAVPDQDDANEDLAGRVISVEEVAQRVVEAIDANELYVLPHEESREFVRRRFARIDASFDRQHGSRG